MQRVALSQAYAETIQNYKAVLKGEKIMLSCVGTTLDETNHEVKRQFATIFIDATSDVETARQDRATEIAIKYPQFCGCIVVSVVETEKITQQLANLQTWIALQ